MVESITALDHVLKAISDPVRRQILASLQSGPATVGQIAEPHDMSFSGAAKHVNILVRANLITKQREGNQQICSLNADPLMDLQAWIDSYADFWGSRLDCLELAVEEFEDEQ